MAAPAFPYTIEKIDSTSKLDEASVQQIKATLASAFAKDPLTAVVTDNDEAFYGDFHYATVIAGSLGGEVYVAKANSEKDTIVGVAVWYPPGRELFDSDDQKRDALSILWNRFDEDLKGWWAETFLPSYAEFATSSFGEGFKLNAWHLQTLGVHPDHQRMGIGRRLINEIKPKAVEANVSLVLETDTELNVKIYEKLGFKVKGKTTFKRRQDSLPMWGLQQDVQDF